MSHAATSSDLGHDMGTIIGAALTWGAVAADIATGQGFWTATTGIACVGLGISFLANYGRMCDSAQRMASHGRAIHQRVTIRLWRRRTK